MALRWRSFDSYGRPTCATKSAQPQRHGGQLNGQVAARANINSAHSAKWRFVAPVLSVRHQSTADMHRDEHNVTATRPSSAPAVSRAFGVERRGLGDVGSLQGVNERLSLSAAQGTETVPRLVRCGALRHLRQHTKRHARARRVLLRHRGQRRDSGDSTFYHQSSCAAEYAVR